MAFKLTFLGTSASVPSAERNHPSLLIESGGQRILVDCGEGTQRQLLRAGAGFRRLDRLLLTHANFDHVLGIPGLFSTLRLRRSEELVSVHGSQDTLDVVVRMLAGLWGEGRPPISLDLVPLTPGLVVDANEFRIECFQVRHRDTDSYGFVFETPRRRHLRPDRLAALAVPDGPIRKELVEGLPSSSAMARRLHLKMFLGRPKAPRSLSSSATPRPPMVWENRYAAPICWSLKPRSFNEIQPWPATTAISQRRRPHRWRRTTM